MAEESTIARPYASAVFKLAKEQSDYQAWSDMLTVISMVTVDAEMVKLMDNPHISKDQLSDLVIQVAGDDLNEQGQNFVRLLAEAGRLSVMLEVTVIYEYMRSQVESIVKAIMVSAFAVTDSQKAAIVASLKKRLNQDVELECKIDSSLMGGAIIRAGDLIIDGSVKGRIEKLSTVLTH